MKYREIQGRRERSFHWAQMLRTKLMESSFSVRTSDFSGSASSLLELTRAETSLTLYFTILGMTKICKLSLGDTVFWEWGGGGKVLVCPPFQLFFGQNKFVMKLFSMSEFVLESKVIPP